MRTTSATPSEPAPLGSVDAGCGVPVRGWSPPLLPADTPLKRRVDRVLPRRGTPAVVFFGVVIGLLALAPHLPLRAELATDAVAALAGGAWCTLNFWRCRHAHCAVTGMGWLGLAAFGFAESALGRSVIGGNEQPVFLGVLVAALLFEGAWYRARGSNAVILRSGVLPPH